MKFPWTLVAVLAALLGAALGIACLLHLRSPGLAIAVAIAPNAALSLAYAWANRD